MKEFFKDYIHQNFKIIVMLFMFVIIGIVLGIIMYQVVSDEIKNDYINTMRETLELTKKENFKGINIIKNGMISNIILVSIIYFTSITLISPYLVTLISFFKGFSIGIYIPTLFTIFGISKGTLAIILLIIIPNIIYIPSYIFIGTNSVNFHYQLLSGEHKMMLSIKEIFKLITGFSVMFMGVILEQLVSGWIILLYSSV